MSKPRPTLDDQLKAAERELAMRKSAYPKWIEAGRMTAAKAESEIAVMEAIVANLRFQLKYAAAFRRLARDLIAAEKMPAVEAVRETFPDADMDVQEQQ